MNNLIQDARYGLRMLAKNPGFTAVVVLSLAMGIGANTAIFTLIDAVLFKTLPVERPEQLVLFDDAPSEGEMRGDQAGRWQIFSYPSFEYFRNQNQFFQGLCAFRSGEDRLSVRVSGEPVHEAWGHLVSGNYFAVTGVNAILGRVLTLEDDVAGARPAAVISYSYWKERFNRDPSVIGINADLNGTAFTIVGVTPPGFFGVRVRSAPDFWLPLTMQPQVMLRRSFLDDPKRYWLNLLGRLKPGTGIDQAQASTNVQLRQFLTQQAGAQISADLRRPFQESYVRLVPGGRGISLLRFRYLEPLHILMAIVVLVLLIACANVGNLLLSRAVARRTELSLRQALGASHPRLVRQLLTESLLLAGLGGAVGMLFAHWGVGGLVAMVAKRPPLDVNPDAKVLGFTLGVSLCAAMLFGLAPALRASRVELVPGLKGSASRLGTHRFGLSSVLVVSQVALSLLLLIGAGLFARSLVNLERVELGFNRHNILLVDIDPRLAGYKPSQLGPLYRQLLDRINALHGVRSASLAAYSPLSGHSRSSTIAIEGYVPRPAQDMMVQTNFVAPKYSETLGIPLLLGREIGPRDTSESAKVALVNEAFAKYFFPQENPLGRRFGDDPRQSDEIEIVGVVKDAKYNNARETPPRMVYFPILQVQDQSVYSSNLEIRTDGNPLGAVAPVRKAIADIDSRLPIAGVTTLSNQVDESLRQERVIAQLSTLFGLLALVLACVGLYGVMVHAVVRQRTEIGIRMALGAGSGDILWMVLSKTLVLVVMGVACGIPSALAAARLISSQLFGLTPGDPLTISMATMLLIAVAALAGYLPARKASRIDPMVALRYE